MKHDGQLYTTGKYSRYKRNNLIAFYDKDGEHFIAIFNNIREILLHKHLELTRKNVVKYGKYINSDLHNANHYTRILDGTLMTIWLIPDDDEGMIE